MADAISGRAVARRSQITTLNFHGTDILVRAGKTPAETLVAMKPVVEGMGLTWQPQHAKLIAHPVLGPTIMEIVTVAEDGKLRTMAALPLNRLHFWLATIHANKVKPALRETVITYQTEAADVLFEHFFGKKLRARQAKPYPDLRLADGRYLVVIRRGKVADVIDAAGSHLVNPADPVNLGTFIREYVPQEHVRIVLDAITRRACPGIPKDAEVKAVPAPFSPGSNLLLDLRSAMLSARVRMDRGEAGSILEALENVFHDFNERNEGRRTSGALLDWNWNRAGGTYSRETGKPVHPVLTKGGAR